MLSRFQNDSKRFEPFLGLKMAQNNFFFFNFFFVVFVNMYV
jgi:hypothetical protein